MRAILINPFDQTITEIDIGPGIKPIYAALSGPTCPRTGPDGEVIQHHVSVSSFDIVRLGVDRNGNTVDLFIDDEGLMLHESIEQAYFRMAPGDEGPPLAGRALILGGDREGDSVATALTLADVQAKVRWCPIGERHGAPDPVIVGFSDWGMLKFLLPNRG